ncbi:MAG: LysR family transcriptional regulator [Sphingomonas sp.]|uniref:LysR family transcriptional regulator n=1 Tax=Sphingomonas sp. TaxID=28214 RepID=UPI0025FE6AB6|nr:LysR family transcriptional regulator [Sphingomonas sp.]MBX9882168.1 LysR family transcriptional regulator [Sphingomonas sp.]
MDWNDLRYFLAVARHGTTLAAGRALKVSQTTVARRVQVLEGDLGLTLFERRPTGYVLTPEGEGLIDQAREVEQRAQAVAALAAAQGRVARGTVKLTTEEIVAVTLLVPVLGALHETHPGITVEIDTSDALRDLGAGDADIALRSCHRPEGNALVARRLSDEIWAFYCSESYAAAHGVPGSMEELANHPIIGGGGPGLWRHYQPWLARYGLEQAVTLHQGSVMGLLASVKAGLGLAALPVLVADHEPGLIRCTPQTPPGGRGLWLLTHERLRHTPRVRAVLDLIADHIIARARASTPTPVLRPEFADAHIVLPPGFQADIGTVQ